MSGLSSRSYSLASSNVPRNYSVFAPEQFKTFGVLNFKVGMVLAQVSPFLVFGMLIGTDFAVSNHKMPSAWDSIWIVGFFVSIFILSVMCASELQAKYLTKDTVIGLIKGGFWGIVQSMMAMNYTIYGYFRLDFDHRELMLNFIVTQVVMVLMLYMIYTGFSLAKF